MSAKSTRVSMDVMMAMSANLCLSCESDTQKMSMFAMGCANIIVCIPVG